MEAFHHLSSALYQGAGFLIEETTTTLGFSWITAQSVSEIIKKFFKEVFYYPDEHKLVIAIIAVVVIVAIVGLIYLIKRVWDRYIVD